MPGPGNPNLRRAAELQKAVRDAVTGEELCLVLRRLLHMAVKDSDVAAARLLLERAIGKPSDEPKQFGIDLGDLSTAAGVAQAMRHVAAATASGDINPNDAAAVTSVLRQVADADSFASLEERIQQLEDQKR